MSIASYYRFANKTKTNILFTILLLRIDLSTIFNKLCNCLRFFIQTCSIFIFQKLPIIWKTKTVQTVILVLRKERFVVGINSRMKNELISYTKLSFSTRAIFVGKRKSNMFLYHC